MGKIIIPLGKLSQRDHLNYPIFAGNFRPAEEDFSVFSWPAWVFHITARYDIYAYMQQEVESSVCSYNLLKICSDLRKCGWREEVATKG